VFLDDNADNCRYVNMSSRDRNGVWKVPEGFRLPLFW
jgi:hypothetical protein